MTQPTRRLLFIDDDAALGRLVQREMGRHGYTVIVTTSGTEGEHLARQGFDAICLDHYMPDQDGLQTLYNLTLLSGVPPIVYVTGSDDGRVAIAALRSGASDYIIKEANVGFLDALRHAVDGAIDRESARREKERREHEVREARDRAEELARQRATLLREVNHRVANSLQLISALAQLQLTSVTDPAARQALSEMTSRIYAVAQVHRRLYTSDDVREVELNEYVSGLLDEIRRSMDHPMGDIRFDMEAVRLAVPTDTAVSIGVIVTELVTNAVKYAYPANESGPIRIILRAQGDCGTLVVEDEGVGLGAPGGGQAQGTGVGQRIIDALASSIHGQVERENSTRGTRISMTFPLASAKAT